eukprot:c27020_g1_i1 orf=85-2037(+)
MDPSVAALKKAVFSVQLALLDGISNPAQIEAAREILTQSEYADVVTERTIVMLCGYPLCDQPLPQEFPRKGRYRISLREHKVYDIQETRWFCSSDCLIASRTFGASLPSGRDVLANCSKLLEFVAAFEGLNVREGARCSQKSQNKMHASGSEVQVGISMPLIIREQNEAQLSSLEEFGPSDAIEGYVPQRSQEKTRSERLSGGVTSSTETPEMTGRVDETGNSTSDVVRSGKVKKVQFQSQKSSSNIGEMVSTESFCSFIVFNEAADKRLDEQSKLSDHPKQKSALRHPKKPHTQQRLRWADGTNFKQLERNATVKGDELISNSGRIGGDSEHLEHNEKAVQETTIGSSGSEECATAVDALECSSASSEVPLRNLNNDRLESAEALAAALTEAATAVASGNADVDEAVARAGICIRPMPYEEEDRMLVMSSVEDTGQGSSMKRLEALQSQDELDLEMVDPLECWYSAPPKEFKAELSSFGVIWMALDGWISAASIAYIYGRDASEEENFVTVNGREYTRKMRIGDGVSSGIERTISGWISRVLPGVVEALRLSVPVSTLEQALGRLLRTMSLIDPLPPFGMKQWCMIVVLFLDALSVQRLPPLRSQFASNRTLLRMVLDLAQTTEAEYEAFKGLVLPMGRQPEFATRCGA